MSTSQQDDRYWLIQTRDPSGTATRATLDTRDHSIQWANTSHNGIAIGNSALPSEPQYSVRGYDDSYPEPHWQSIQNLDAKQSIILAQYFEGVSKEFSKHRATGENLADTQKELEFSNFGLSMLGLSILSFVGLNWWSLRVDDNHKEGLRNALSECENNLDWVRNNGFTMGEAETDSHGTCPNDGIVIEVSSTAQ
ncbi:hypothetical protein V865_007782 [Kwoniella europaea PYCC6329]|uniref:Uncharacterized protein n=1 Tax=Kwoniella europaea PYCC6329 TaxID=1423913 RepID=A0AAX4KUM9_9TREE